MSIEKSKQLFKEACGIIPGGVNSPVRAFKSVGGDPIFMQSAKGAYLYDVDGNRYIDYINSWGPMILGHGNDTVVEAIVRQAREGITFGTPSELEYEMARQICKMVPSLESIRLVSTGTEACMSAVRLARACTKRNKIVKFEGCYHGHADEFLVSAGSGLATLGIQEVPGVTVGVAQDTILLPYNDIDALKALFTQSGEQIAAVIVEPVAGNMGCVLPDLEFLKTLRYLCSMFGGLLIFDEVMTGFRLAPGGAQQLFGIEADLVCYGKVIGGGMPVAAFGGKHIYMNQVAPAGKVYQAGTLSGNPVAVSAGLATLKYLDTHKEIYDELDRKGQLLENALSEAFNANDILHSVNRVGSMISVFFGNLKVKNYKTATESQTDLYKPFFHHMLRNGIYLPPSAFETWFLSIALSDDNIEQTKDVVLKFKI